MSENNIIKRVDQSLPAQRKRILWFVKNSPKHTFFLRGKGICNPSARIQELEAEGHVFGRSRIVAVDSDGFPHRGVTLYEYISGPSSSDQDQ